MRTIAATFTAEIPLLRERGIKCRLLRDGHNKPCGALALYRDLLSLHGVCHKMLLPVTAFREEDVRLASRNGWHLNMTNEKGSAWSVINDTINKASILSKVLLDLPVPQ